MVAFVGVLWASSAWAEALPPDTILNQTGSPVYSTGLPSYVLPENLKAELIAIVFANGQATGLAGTFTSKVYQNPAGGLTFVYQLANAAGSVSVSDLGLGYGHGVEWGGVAVDDAGAAGSGRSPLQIFRNDFPAIGDSPADQSIGMVWDTGGLLATGESSSLVWFQTDAVAWHGDSVGIASSTHAVAGADYLGPSAIPEPTSLASCLVAFVFGMGCVVWKRRGTR